LQEFFLSDCLFGNSRAKAKFCTLGYQSKDKCLQFFTTRAGNAPVFMVKMDSVRLLNGTRPLRVGYESTGLKHFGSAKGTGFVGSALTSSITDGGVGDGTTTVTLIAVA
jgi:hypothetical protein